MRGNFGETLFDKCSFFGPRKKVEKILTVVHHGERGPKCAMAKTWPVRWGPVKGGAATPDGL